MYLRRIACPQYGLRPRQRLLAKTQSSAAVARTFPPFQQSVREKRMNWHRLLRCLRLARTNHPVDDGTRDVHVFLRKVDVFPLQAEHLALPQSRGYRKEDQGAFPNA